METSLALTNLLHRPDIWRGRRAADPGEVRDTGFAELNQILVGGGWPLAGLVEISYPRLGSGEWQLLSGTLASFADQAGYLVLVNPPALLCADALAQMGVPLQRVLIVRSANKEELLAGVLEVLHSNCAQMLLFWETKNTLTYAELRKVQLAASDAHALCVMMRLGARPGLASPAVLRLELQARMTGLHLHILRQRGGLSDGQLELSWPAGWTLQPVDADVLEPRKAATTAQVLAFQAQI